MFSFLNNFPCGINSCAPELGIVTKNIAKINYSYDYQGTPLHILTSKLSSLCARENPYNKHEIKRLIRWFMLLLIFGAKHNIKYKDNTVRQRLNELKNIYNGSRIARIVNLFITELDEHESLEGKSMDRKTTLDILSSRLHTSERYSSYIDTEVLTDRKSNSESLSIKAKKFKSRRKIYNRAIEDICDIAVNPSICCSVM